MSPDRRPYCDPAGADDRLGRHGALRQLQRSIQTSTADGAEPNAVVKAFWPFVRRITPRADFREFIACGVFDWRAIYITALGSNSQYVEGQEREPSQRARKGEAAIRVAAELLGGRQGPCAASAGGPFDSLVHSAHGAAAATIIPCATCCSTKHAPHPRQIGRIAERINTMGTMRLYALKDWSAVRNADAYIRIFGQELDQITKGWGSDRQLINGLTSLKMVRGAQDGQSDEARREARLEPSQNRSQRAERLTTFEPHDRWSVARARCGC